MKIMCAWCNLYLETKAPFDDPGVSHSICERCEVNFLKQLACPWPKGDPDGPREPAH